MRHRMRLCLAALAVAAATVPAAGRIKLAALPVRQRVEIQLDNAGATLVEEERIVPLLQSTPERGNNRIDFSWSNTHIDKNSILFRPLAIRAGGAFRPIREQDGQKEVAVINTAYPPGENALVWEVYAAEACAVKVRVSYLISNLSRTFSYRALADADETHLTLRKYIVLHNFSGEAFGDAGVYAGFGPHFRKPVGQQERIRMLMHKFADVPVDKTFTFDWYAHGPLNDAKPLCSKVLMHYELTNDEAHKMGAFPLQPGKVRIFIDDAKGGEAFLGEDRSPLTPIDDKMKLYLGEARDIVCKRIVETNKRHHIRGNLYDQEIVIKYEIENFKDEPATLRIVEQLNNLARQYLGDPHGDVEWTRGREGTDRTSEEITFRYPEDGTTPVLHVDLPARPEDEDEKVEKVVVRFHVTLKNLWN